MEKYFIACIKGSIEVIAFKAKSKEELIEKAKRCGMNVNWVIKEVKKESQEFDLKENYVYHDESDKKVVKTAIKEVKSEVKKQKACIKLK